LSKDEKWRPCPTLPPNTTVLEEGAPKSLWDQLPVRPGEGTAPLLKAWGLAGPGVYPLHRKINNKSKTVILPLWVAWLP
jgi:hypothetical protein